MPDGDNNYSENLQAFSCNYLETVRGIAAREWWRMKPSDKPI